MMKETTPKSAALTENKSFFEAFLEGMVRDIPEEEWAKIPKSTIFENLAVNFGDLPDEMLAELPTDGAENHDHCLYGAPKKSAQ